MEIRILQLIEGARAAEGLTVVIDVFRAFSLEAYLFDSGVLHIYPIGKVETAYRMREEHPELLLAGERGGKILPDFDFGNAPSSLGGRALAGRTVIHTTSAGTQGVANAQGADEILVASLVNARATADYIRESGAEIVSLVCMGLEGRAETEEDTLCARYIKACLEGTAEEMDWPQELAHLRETSGSKFFDPTQADVFPRADFDLCTRVDAFDFVMCVRRDAPTPYVEKIERGR